MRSNAVRVVVGIGLVAVAVVLLILLKDDGSSSSDGNGTMTTKPTPSPAGDQPASEAPSAPAVPTIVVKDGKPVGGVRELSFEAGEEIRFKVESNEGDEVHVHGYDVEKEVPAGGSATLSFPADIEGIFEVELHHSEELIAELRVNP